MDGYDNGVLLSANSTADTQAITLFLDTPLWVIILMCATVLFGECGNLGLIIMVCRQPTLRTSPTFILLISMALSDVVLLATAPSFDIFYAVQNSTPLGVACFIRLFCVLFSAATTLYHLMSFSVLRYLILIHPLFSRVHVTAKNIAVLATAIWIASFAGAGSTMTISGNYGITTSDNITLIFCALNPENNVQYTLVLVALAIPFVVMIGFHIAKVIKLKNRKFSESDISQNRRNVSTKVVMSLILTFCCCWSPTVLYTLVLYFLEGDLSSDVYQLMPMFMCLLYANSAFNPLLYYFLSKRWKLMCCKAQAME